MIIFCLVPMVNYWSRTITPSPWFTRMLELVDKRTVIVTALLFEWNLNDVTPEIAEQMMLGFRHGGLSLRSQALTAPAAWLASLAQVFWTAGTCYPQITAALHRAVGLAPAAQPEMIRRIGEVITAVRDAIDPTAFAPGGKLCGFPTAENWTPASLARWHFGLQALLSRAMQSRAARLLRERLSATQKLLMDSASSGPLGETGGMIWARIYPTSWKKVVHPWALRLFSRLRFNLPMKTMQKILRAGTWLQCKCGEHLDIFGQHLLVCMRSSPSKTLVHDMFKHALHDCLRRIPGVQRLFVEKWHALSPEKRGDIICVIDDAVWIIDVTARPETGASNTRFGAQDAGGRARSKDGVWPNWTLLHEMERIKRGEYPTLSKADTPGKLIAVAALYVGVRFSFTGSAALDILWEKGHASLHGNSLTDFAKSAMAQKCSEWRQNWRQECAAAIVNGVAEMVLKRLRRKIIESITPEVPMNSPLIMDMWCGCSPGRGIYYDADTGRDANRLLHEKPFLHPKNPRPTDVGFNVPFRHG